ncbi:MAG: MEDS domain-containing protein [Chloroflexi bacterium]|nr:MEDS domain-containing protein [Chloroflexota bacterium]
MPTEMRKSGIAAMGEMPWGTHFCHFYETKQDLIETLVRYFKVGLENNEFCMWITSDSQSQDARHALRQAMPAADGHLEAGDIEIHPYTQWYLKDGVFDAARVVNGWYSKLAQALTRGYAGMRVAADEAWLDQRYWKAFSDYERDLDEPLSHKRVIVVCAYSLATCGAAEILDVSHTHQFAIAKRRGSWETLEAPELKQAKQELKRLNDELERRVAERTRTLAEANQALRQEIAERQRVQDQLRHSEARYRALYRDNPTMIFTLDAEGTVLSANSFAAAQLGYTVNELEGQSVLNVFHADDRPAVAEQLRMAFKSPYQVHRWQFRKIRKDGSLLWVDELAQAVNDLNGALNVLVVCQDITTRKRAEQALRESEQKLAEAQRVAHVGYWDRDTVTERLTWSDETYRIFGITPEERDLTVTRVRELIHPDDRQQVFEAVEQALSGGPRYNAEYRVVRPDGQVRVVHSQGDVTWDDKGYPRRLFGVIQDITERKRAEEQIQREAARTDALLRIARVVSAQLDLKTVIHTICEETCRVMNVPATLVSLLDQNREVFQVAGYAGVLPELVAQLKPVPRAFYERHLTADGSLLVIPDALDDPDQPNLDQIRATNARTVVGAPMFREGHLIGSLNVVTMGAVRKFKDEEIQLLRGLADQAALAIENARLFTSVREQREQQSVLSAQLVQAQETERRAIARELHDELGQILNAVSTNLQTIQLTRRRSTRAERLQESINLVDDALRRTRDLALDLRPSMLDDFGLVPALEWYVDRQAQRSGFAAELVVEPPILRLLPSLETMCFRVVQIALTNVARHARAKHVRVELNRHATDLELTVRDDGVGFDVDQAMEGAVRGRTLGLLSMQERVRLAGGEIQVKSAPGQGTEICARFPLE